jgi:hypothetical protein
MNKLGAIETSIGIHYIEGDVLYIIFKDGISVDVKDLEESKNARIVLQQGNSMKVLVDTRGLFQITKEARAYAAEPKSAEMSIAMAILSDSLGTKLLTNFFIKYNKPSTPTKMFTSKEKALEWLAEFK